jgi:hypothetical protein
VETATRLHRRADDDELRTALRGGAGNFLAETPRTRADDFAPHGDAVRARHRLRPLESLLQPGELSVEMSVQRQLALDDEGRDEDDLGTPVGREPASQVERVLGLLPVEQRQDDAPVRDRLGPKRDTPVERPDVRKLHRMSWYGTEARITFGSTSSSRFT